MKKVKILIADDHVIARNGLRAMLEEQSEFTPELFETESGAGAIDLLSKEQFDVLLLDLEMPKVDGFKTLNMLRENGNSTPVIIFSFHNDEALVNRARNCGANGYLPKGVSVEELTHGILAVIEDKGFVNGSTDKVEIDQDQSIRLTNRETEVLKLIAAERSNYEIADELGISVRTVEGHKKNLTDKLMVKGSVGLTKYAMKHGFVGNS